MRALRRLFGFVVFAAVAAAAAIFVRRRASGARERVDLYYADGSMASLTHDAPDAERLLGFARDAVTAARSA